MGWIDRTDLGCPRPRFASDPNTAHQLTCIYLGFHAGSSYIFHCERIHVTGQRSGGVAARNHQSDSYGECPIRRHMHDSEAAETRLTLEVHVHCTRPSSPVGPGPGTVGVRNLSSAPT